MPDQKTHLRVAPEPDHCPGAGTVHSTEAPTDDDDEQPGTEAEPQAEPAEPVVLRRARAPNGGEYRATECGLTYVSSGVETQLTNFDAVLLRKARRLDRTDIGLRVQIRDVTRDLTMSSARYESLRWITDDVPGGVLAPVPAAKARLLAAVTLLSASITEEVEVVEHLGWRQDGDGRRTYVHAGGAIGASGPVAVNVEVGEPLDRFELPEPEQVDPTLPLDILGLAPDRVVVTMLASMVRAVFGDVRFAVHTWGPSGGGKSQLAAVLAGHWGAAMAEDRNLPCSWSSTSNSTELITNAAKDCVVVVDDWLPQMTSPEEVDRLVRAAGNASGRARMGSPARPPRALVWSTGEAAPTRPASLLARMLSIRLGPDDLDWQRLTTLQRLGREGAHAAWLNGFLRWCAPQLDELRGRLERFGADGRRRWSSFACHARTVDALATLEGAWRILCGYLWTVGGLDIMEVKGLVERGEAALVEVAREQERAQLGGDPVRFFLASLRDLVEGGVVRVSRSSKGVDSDGTPVIGWLRGSELLLDGGAALAAVQDHLRERGAVLDVTEQQLGRMLRAAGLLVRVDSRGSKVRFGVRVTVAGVRRRVLVLRADALGLGEGEPSGPA